MRKVLFVMFAVLAVVLMAQPAMAETGAMAGGGGLNGIAAALAVGIAAFGAASGQGKATASAMESIGRNPNSADKIFTPLLLGLALMEAIALYGFVIAFFLQQKV